MARRGTEEPTEWAAQVRSVPFRRVAREKLVRFVRSQGLGFSPAEIGRIQAYFRAAGREPTDVELAGLAQSWSEHCSYKSSRPFLRAAFSSLHPKPKVLGTGDAGVIRFEDGFAYALRIESHNHPSAVEPYGGAATGIGGILRDVLAVGAKPIGLADPLFFGPLPTNPGALPKGVKSPRYLMGSVVAGIRDYGNRVGVPTISGGVYFDPAYVVNPLVNVGCVGWLPTARLVPNRADRIGDRLVLVGAHTGRDGIGGVAFASRELTSRSEEESRGAVQLGNPILKEPLIKACVEAYEAGLVRGCKDLGGGGLASACGELVNAGGFGSIVHLDRVPLREAALTPWEVWISESQERMLLDVRPTDLEPLLAIFRRWDVPAADVGEVVAGPYETLMVGDRPAAHLKVGFRVDPPSLRRPIRRRRSAAAPRTPIPNTDPGEMLERLTLAPDSVSRESILRVYDHEVQGRTVIKPLHGRVVSPSHGDAAVLRPRPESWRGLAVTVAAQPWACREDPRRGAIWVVEEAARNLYAVGAEPDAFTNCLNFGNPEDPEVLGDFSEVVKGLAEGARAFGMAVPSGNVSFYNGGLGAGIPPTPVLMATGIVEDLHHVTTSDLKHGGDSLYLVGRSSPALGGSLWARLSHHRGLSLPPTEPGKVRALGERLLTWAASGRINAIHDISDGGLAVTLAEMAFGGSLGFDVALDPVGLETPAHALAAEGGSRWVVEVPEPEVRRFERGISGLPVARLGSVTDRYAARLSWRERELARIDLPGLYSRWRAGLDVL
jgi:phosphoribosylformylglycinamidine synthase subunit PurL